MCVTENRTNNSGSFSYSFLTTQIIVAIDPWIEWNNNFFLLGSVIIVKNCWKFMGIFAEPYDFLWEYPNSKGGMSTSRMIFFTKPGVQSGPHFQIITIYFFNSFVLLFSQFFTWNSNDLLFLVPQWQIYSWINDSPWASTNVYLIFL